MLFTPSTRQSKISLLPSNTDEPNESAKPQGFQPYSRPALRLRAVIGGQEGLERQRPSHQWALRRCANGVNSTIRARLTKFFDQKIRWIAAGSCNSSTTISKVAVSTGVRSPARTTLSTTSSCASYARRYLSTRKPHWSLICPSSRWPPRSEPTKMQRMVKWTLSLKERKRYG